MKELAKRFIDKECLIYTFNGNQHDCTIKEVTDGAILVEKAGTTEAINLDFIVINWLTVNQHFTAVCGKHIHQNTNRRGLAGTVSAEQTESFSALSLE